MIKPIPVKTQQNSKFLKPQKQAAIKVNQEIFETNNVIKNPEPFLNKLCVFIKVKDQRRVNKNPMYFIIMSQYCNCGKD